MSWVPAVGYFDCLEEVPEANSGPHYHPESHPFWHKMGRPSSRKPDYRACTERGCSYLERRIYD